jgi:hypothetical protein
VTRRRDTRDLITGIEAKRDTPVESPDTMSGALHRRSQTRKLLIEVLDRPVAATQTLRLAAGHGVRADRASLKSAFVVTHVRPEKLVKEFPRWGDLQLCRLEKLRKFQYIRCHAAKKSKLVAVQVPPLSVSRN